MASLLWFKDIEEDVEKVYLTTQAERYCFLNALLKWVSSEFVNVQMRSTQSPYNDAKANILGIW